VATAQRLCCRIHIKHLLCVLWLLQQNPHVEDPLIKKGSPDAAGVIIVPVVIPSAVHRLTVPIANPGRLMLQLLGLLLCRRAVQLPSREHSAPALFARLPSRLYAMDCPIALQPRMSPGMKELVHLLINAADCAAASVLNRRGAIKLCMPVMHCLQASQGLSTTGAGAGGGGAGLAWQVLRSSQPSVPPMQRHTDTVMSLLQNWSLPQSVSKMQVVAAAAPAGHTSACKGTCFKAT
jgi:hypothetical protein